MATVPEVSTITGNTIKLTVYPDTRSGSPDTGSDSGQKSDSSLGHRSFDEGEFTTLSLNTLIEKAVVEQNSDIGRDIRKYLLLDEPVPKRLIYTVLKEALDHVDPSKPVLIVDRRLSLDKTLRMLNDTHPISVGTQTDNGHSPRLSQRKPNNEIVTLGITSQFQDPTNASRKPSILEEGETHKQPKTWPLRILNMVKHALCPPDAAVPPKESTENQKEDKSNVVIRYFEKMRGGQKRPPYDRPLEALQSLIVSFVGMLVLTVIDFHVLTDTDYTLVIGSFGATAVLVFCAIKSPLAQPRNVFGGHLLAAIIGAACQLLLGQQYPWLAAALAVSVSIAIMSLTNTVHPPAGATALIAVYSNEKIHKIGFMYILTPVLGGAGILVVVAVLMNNLFPSRRYPLYWF